MSIRMREHLSLVRELLGPRKGMTEHMDRDPRSEYITGILEPSSFKREMPEDYGKADIGTFVPEQNFEDDNADTTEDFEIGSKILHPLSLPKTMGISFMINSEIHLFDACFTWARYEGSFNAGWNRKNFIFVEKNIDASKTRLEWHASVDPEVEMVMMSNKMPDGNYHVSLYLVNNAKFKDYLETNHLVFQPQIRINLKKGSVLYSVLPTRRIKTSKKTGPDEDERLDMLFRNHKALARGHMCGATWKDIDPERPFQGKTLPEIIPQDISSEAFEKAGYSKEYADYFVNPDLRTDYLPIYSINQSTVEFDMIDGLKKEDWDADMLADKYVISDLIPLLKNFVSKYEAWLQSEKSKANNLEGYDAAASYNITKCDESFARMSEGIRVIETDENARLAFCFMNKAMHIQAKWKGREGMVWRPFQMGFILQCLSGISNRFHDDRKICDLLWYPTGGGKTEAYLGLLVFTTALRRLQKENLSGYGTAAISRYTLRLLTVQQFRRTLSVMTACEYLRVLNWTPKNVQKKEQMWGTVRFSAGLWVGGAITPNSLVDRKSFDKDERVPVRYVGAVSILQYNHEQPTVLGERIFYEGDEPAQVITCPACSSVLAFPSSGIHGENHEIFLLINCEKKPHVKASEIDYPPIKVTEEPIIHSLPRPNYYIIQIKFKAVLGNEGDRKINNWWKNMLGKKICGEIQSCAASRPGYFIKRSPLRKNDPWSAGAPVDIEIHCLNPKCPLNEDNTVWSESILSADGTKHHSAITPPFAIPEKENFGWGIPIPAYVIDAQIYNRCPSIVICTVDKFARLPFLPESAAMFGNVDVFDDVWGFHRNNIPPDFGSTKQGEVFPFHGFLPPDLIIQDELHLIDGPLGSMVGMYESILDVLCSYQKEGKKIIPKYVASTATIRKAESQIASLYCRSLSQFPPQGLTIGDNFFSSSKEAHPQDDSGPGRLYVGVCAPGKGPLTPTNRIWASLMQESEVIRQENGGKVAGDLSYYWTTVGYFNAIRELAGIRAAYRQDIQDWINVMASRQGSPCTGRVIHDYQCLELHSNIPDKQNISAIIEKLEKEVTEVDAVLATSMFGTGVDIDRLSLMIVHGQPKTTSSYIQATGRVGRQKGALVVTFLRSSRARDLGHYEFFTGYHRALYRHVEGITVFPFSPGACERGLLPVFVSILRNGRSVDGVPIDPNWASEGGHWNKPVGNPPAIGYSGSRLMGTRRTSKTSPELEKIILELEKRNESQPEFRKQEDVFVTKKINADLSKWEIDAINEASLFYSEVAFSRMPKFSVVLGDEKHKNVPNLSTVKNNVPHSLRSVESSTRFRDR